MYGIVNKSIQDLVTEQFGSDTWDAVLEKSNINVSFFMSNEPYDDAITYRLAQAVSDISGLSLSEVLNTFGEYWVLKTGKEKYGSLMQAGGANLKAFLLNLPNFHNRIMLIYPKLTPPDFQVSDVTDYSMHIHYRSKREGLQEFVRGLLHGLGKMYQTKVDVTLLQSRNDGSDHEIFKISWA